MHGMKFLIVAAALALCLAACGPTPGQVNDSGHEPYLGGDYEGALESYQEARERAPGYGEPYYNTGNVLYRTEEYAEALQSYDESLRRSGGELRSRGFFNRGNAAFRQQDYPQAVEAYEEVLRMNPDHGDAKHNLELALQRMAQQNEQQQEQQEDEQQEQEQQDDSQDQEQQEEERQQDEQAGEQAEDERDQPMSQAQARRILESVGETAQTLQERRGQVLVSPKPTPEFDW